jgi:hypothetical protein
MGGRLLNDSTRFEGTSETELIQSPNGRAMPARDAALSFVDLEWSEHATRVSLRKHNHPSGVSYNAMFFDNAKRLGGLAPKGPWVVATGVATQGRKPRDAEPVETEYVFIIPPQRGGGKRRLRKRASSPAPPTPPLRSNLVPTHSRAKVTGEQSPELACLPSATGWSARSDFLAHSPRYGNGRRQSPRARRTPAASRRTKPCPSTPSLITQHSSPPPSVRRLAPAHHEKTRLEARAQPPTSAFEKPRKKSHPKPY